MLLTWNFYNTFGISQIPEKKTKDVVYACTDYEQFFHCDPTLYKFKSYAIRGNESQVYPVTRNDSTYTNGKFDKGLEIHDGYREYVEINNTNKYDVDTFSVSFWLKSVPKTSPYGHVISFTNKENTAGWFFDSAVDQGETNSNNQSLRFVLTNSYGNNTFSKYISVSNSTYVHIIGTFNDSTIKLYKDGNLIQEIKYRGNYTANPKLPLHIGSASYCSSCNRWAGIIDDIRFYNRSLSDNEAKQLFGSGMNNSVLDSLIGHWKLNGDLNDTSGNNNHGKMFTPIGSMVFSPDGRLFFTEKNTGRIMIMENDSILEEPFVTITDHYVSWEEGLLGLAVDPNFEKNHYIYLYYTALKYGEPVNRVVRFTDINNTAAEEVVIIDDISASRGFHAGGALAMGPDNKIYITVGDATEHELAQSTSVDVGKVLRLNTDGTIPSDNPYPNSPVYTIGHRNMYGIAFDNMSGLGLVAENGDILYDELNIINKGGNYGFPTLQIPNLPPEMTNSSDSIKPIRSYWNTVAPTQTMFYTGDKFPLLKDKFLFGTFTGNIYAVHIDNESKHITDENHILFRHYPFEPIIGVAQSPNGDIYYGSYHINKLTSLALNNTRQDVFPIEITLPYDTVIDKIDLSKNKSMLVELHRNSTHPNLVYPQNMTIKSPKVLFSDLIDVGAIFNSENVNSSKTDINYTIPDNNKNYSLINIELPKDEQLQILVNSTKLKNNTKVTDNAQVTSINETAYLYDNFDNEEYLLNEAQVSPNNLWFNVYSAGGIAGVKKDINQNNLFFLTSNTSSALNQSYSSLVTTTKSFSDFELSADVKTEKQLRQNDPPNPWEVAWIFFRYADDQHNYWLIAKPTGIELAKKDCNTCAPTQEPVYLYTNNEPQFEIGDWSNLYIKAVKNHITIAVNGSKVIDYIDNDTSSNLKNGTIGLYANDAAVSFDNIYIKSLK
jgi:glucose/arabinose dehydrogenase